ncbi:OB-fold nucleic acid binding protein [Cladophialophora carrionii]|uniref:OB-fold nucleic acid binding protein n=1 Tax=Cladophialophora carrionii TaxID=86049 RepID=A0A1C1C764_9EURO|nr:OB-fold nucleic acid binding protein [Cladophialophora carrionii]
MQRHRSPSSAHISTLTAGGTASPKLRAQAGAKAQARTAGRDHALAPAKTGQLTFYPAFTFKASATWSKWVKLTCHDVHSVLKPHDEFSTVTTSNGRDLDEPSSTYGRKDLPLLLFYLNHPIQFVQVIGVVVVLEEYFEKFWLFTVDDGSGATVDVTFPKPEKEKTPGAVSTSSKREVEPNPTSTGEDEEVGAEQHLQTTLSLLRIGTVVQAKGTLTIFRQTRQLSLIRLNVLPSTTHEMALVSSRSQFYASILSRPWILSQEEQIRLRMVAQGERDEAVELARKRRKREHHKRAREERHRKVIEQEYARDEEARRKEAAEAKKRGDVLNKSRQKAPKPEQEVWITVE